MQLAECSLPLAAAARNIVSCAIRYAWKPEDLESAIALLGAALAAGRPLPLLKQCGPPCSAGEHQISYTMLASSILQRARSRSRPSITRRAAAQVKTSVLKDGSKLESDIVLVGVGARPNVELFKGQLDLLEERPGGIKVRPGPAPARPMARAALALTTPDQGLQEV